LAGGKEYGCGGWGGEGWGGGGGGGGGCGGGGGGDDDWACFTKAALLAARDLSLNGQKVPAAYI